MADSEIGAIREELSAIRDLIAEMVRLQGELIHALAAEDEHEVELKDLDGHEYGRERDQTDEL